MADPTRKGMMLRAADRRRALLASTSLIAALAAVTAPRAAAQTVLPTHGAVSSGAAAISQSGAAMTVNQTSSRAVINWNSFSIGAGDSVNFVQPNASAATLNRVTGSTTSAIAGSLNANGQVYLVNPNGIAITRSGTVNVGGAFVASTLGITDSNFNKGNLSFSGGGASTAVSNSGAIATAPGGFVGLLGGSVANSGTISAPIGKVGLGSGEQATLDPTGDGFLQVALPTNAQTANGQALVDVSGKVKAAGGVVVIKAATAANAVRNAINLSGVASARSARAVGGSIVLGGGAGGDVKVSGKLDASGRKGGGSIAVVGRNATLVHAKLAVRSSEGKGGAVAVTATRAVSLAASAVDASGATGGGKIAIGGNSRGLGLLPDAATTTISAGSVLSANALSSGDGGSIVVWSDKSTSVAGQIFARGGAAGGEGGSVETSGASLDVNGLHVDTTAAHGATGSWLLDPNNFVIASSGGDITGAALGAELATTNVTILSSQGAGGALGEIYVQDAVTWASANKLTLDAYTNITVEQNITVTGSGSVALIIGDRDQTGAGSNDLGFLQFVGYSGFTGFTGSLSFTGANGAIAANPVSINGVNYKLLQTQADLAQMQTNPNGNFALGSDIALTGTYTTSVVSDFFGHLEGLGHTISGLSITPGAATSNVGFFGVLDTSAGIPAEISNVLFLNPVVDGGAANNVGAVAGTNNGEVYNIFIGGGSVSGTGANIGGFVGANTGFLYNDYGSQSVTGGDNVGGLAGSNTGGVSLGVSSSNISGDTDVGGVVGLNSGYINTGSTGSITGNAGSVGIGGVVGENDHATGDFIFQGTDYGPNGTVTGAYGFGNVQGATGVGGVVGINGGAISSSFFNGPVSGTTSVGGVAGENLYNTEIPTQQGAISESYAIGPVSGTTNVGGLVGEDTGAIDASFAMGAVNGQTNVGGLVGQLIANGDGAGFTFTNASVTNSYSTGAVSGTASTPPTVGGAIGAVQLTGGAPDTITNVYWDTLTSGQPTVSAGGTGEKTADLQGATTLAFGGEFTGGAAGGQTGIYPYPTALFGNGVRAVSGVAYQDSAGTLTLASSAKGAVTVFVDTNPYSSSAAAGGADLSATTGANGYYYAFSGTNDPQERADIVAYIPANSTTGATNAASYVVASTAPNTTGVNIYGSTLTETTGNQLSGTAITTSYIQVKFAVIDATFNDPTATSVLSNVSRMVINATGANFTIDSPISTSEAATTTTAAVTINSDGALAVNQPISTSSSLTINAPTTALAANVTASGGATFNNPVMLGTTVTVNSGTAITTFANTIDGSATPGAGLTVTGPVALGGNVTTSNGALTFNGPATVNNSVTLNSGTATTTFGSTIDSSSLPDFPITTDASLTATAGAFSFGGAIGGKFTLNNVSLTSGGALTLPAINANNATATTTGNGAGITLSSIDAEFIFAQTQGANANITISPGATLTAAGVGVDVTLVATGDFVNEAGPNAIVQPTPAATGVPEPQSWAIYSNNPTNDTFDGLDSGNRAIWNSTYTSTSTPTASEGDHYLFAFQPTATFTSVSDSKTYGQDATAKVALDFTVSGIEQGVAGAFLGDTAATVYSGAPSVTSLGAPTTATVAGGPYPINVAQGSLTALNGYKLAYASTGQLTVNPEGLTITAATNTKNYDGTTSASALPTVTSGILYDPATLSETYASPNAGTGLTLNPAIAFTNPAVASNYAVTLIPVQTGVIDQALIVVTATTNTKNYDATTAALALPTLTSGTLPDTTTFSETYATANAGRGLTLNPAVTFANPEVASNYAITLVPVQTGVINPEPITIAAAANTKIYNATTDATAAPTVTLGTLYDPATLSETYASANAGSGLQLNPAIAFTNPAAASNYVVTSVPVQTGVIDPEPVTITATPNTKGYDGTTSAAALPTVTNGTLYDPATLSESYASPNPSLGVSLIPAIAFTDPPAANNYVITLAPTGTTPPNTGIITPSAVFTSTVISTSPSVLANETKEQPEVASPEVGFACGASILEPPTNSALASPGSAISAVSAVVAQGLSRCHDASQAEIGNALDLYADALEIIIQKMPPKLRQQLRQLPAIVHAAAVRARAAPTRMAAVRILRQTVAEVHREIMLVRADDPDAARIRTAVSAGVSGVLNSAALALTRAEGI